MLRRPALWPALVCALALTACTTTVSGSGRPGTAATAAPSGSTTSSPGIAPIDLWDASRDAVVELPQVTVKGSFAGAGFGPSATGYTTVSAQYGSSKDGDPLANVTVVTGGQTLTVRATGGTAWARASAALLTTYGYSAADAAKAADKWAVLTDDDKGLDVLASLSSFLLICGPDRSTTDLTATPGVKGHLVLASQTDGGSVTITTTPARILSSQYTGDDLTFDYPQAGFDVAAPAAADVVTIPDF